MVVPYWSGLLQGLTHAPGTQLFTSVGKLVKQMFYLFFKKSVTVIHILKQSMTANVWMTSNKLYDQHLSDIRLISMVRLELILLLGIRLATNLGERGLRDSWVYGQCSCSFGVLFLVCGSCCINQLCYCFLSNVYRESVCAKVMKSCIGQLVIYPSKDLSGCS